MKRSCIVGRQGWSDPDARSGMGSRAEMGPRQQVCGFQMPVRNPVHFDLYAKIKQDAVWLDRATTTM